MKNYDDILDSLLKIEKEHKLFDILDENGIPKWLFLRGQFLSLYFYSESTHNFLNIKSDPKIFGFVKRSFYGFFKYLFLLFKIRKIKNIVLVPEKSIYSDTNLISAFMEDYLDDEILFLEIPTTHSGKWKKVKHKNYIPLDFLFGFKLVFYFFYRKIIKNNDFDSVINLLEDGKKSRFKNEIIYKDASRKFAIFLINTLFKNKNIFHVGDTIGFSLINNSRVTEIQFGLFNKLRYTFPENKNIDNFLKNYKLLYYQNYLLNKLINSGYKKNNLINIEKKPEIYTFLKYFVQDKGIKNKIKKILIIEQPSIDRYAILDKIFDLLKLEKFTNLEFGFKKHPNSYKDFNFNNNGINKIIFYSNEKHIYRILEEYDYILSIDSTVIFEAMQFDKNIITVYDNKDDYLGNVRTLVGDYKNHKHIDIADLVNLFKNI